MQIKLMNLFSVRVAAKNKQKQSNFHAKILDITKVGRAEPLGRDGAWMVPLY